MVFLGLGVGLLFGLLSGFFLLGMIFSGVAVAGVFGPVFAAIAAWAAPFLALPFLLAFLIWYLINTLIFWLLAIPAQASVTIPATVPGAPTRVPFAPVQNFYRGFGFGTAATVNLAILLPFFANPVLAVIGLLSLAPVLAVFNPVRLNLFYQGILGWMCWVLPVHWLGNVVAFIMFLALLPFALATFGLGAIRFDLTSGTIESRVPLAGTAFNTANFSFILLARTPGAFLGASVSSHEVGHNINSGAMTPFYSLGTVIEEFRVFGGASGAAISQMATESRGAPRNGRLFSPTWSP